MPEPVKAKRRDQSVMGYHLPEARLTPWAAFWAFVYFGLPVLALGLLMDVVVQFFTGRCVGLWCYF